MKSIFFSTLRSRVILQKANFSAILSKHTTNSNVPLVENFRSVWPDPSHQLQGEPLNLPPRTVLDSALRFRFTATFSHGIDLFYPHLKCHPSDFKVLMFVSLKDLPLSDEEKQVFIRMVGPRYKTGQQEFRFISDRFSNRIENKKFLTLQLEQLLVEAKNLNKLRDQYPEEVDRGW